MMNSLKFVRAVTAQVQGTPSTESDPSTVTEVTSGDAAVEIERLKADNQLQIEISALEAEAAEIEMMAGGIEELEGVTEEVGELKEAVESRLETGGLTKGEAQFVQMQLNTIQRRTGLVTNFASVESFSGSAQDRIDLTVASLEGIGETLKNAWEAIKKFFKRIWDRIKGFFGSSKETAEKEKEETDKAKEDAKNDEGGTKVEVPASSPAAPGDKSETKNDTGTGGKEVIVSAYKPEEALENTMKFFEEYANCVSGVDSQLDSFANAVKTLASSNGVGSAQANVTMSKIDPKKINVIKEMIAKLFESTAGNESGSNDTHMWFITGQLIGRHRAKVSFNIAKEEVWMKFNFLKPDNTNNAGPNQLIDKEEYITMLDKSSKVLEKLVNLYSKYDSSVKDIEKHIDKYMKSDEYDYKDVLPLMRNFISEITTGAIISNASTVLGACRKVRQDITKARLKNKQGKK